MDRDDGGLIRVGRFVPEGEAEGAAADGGRAVQYAVGIGHIAQRGRAAVGDETAQVHGTGVAVHGRAAGGHIGVKRPVDAEVNGVRGQRQRVVIGLEGAAVRQLQGTDGDGVAVRVLAGGSGQRTVEGGGLAVGRGRDGGGQGGLVLAVGLALTGIGSHGDGGLSDVRRDAGGLGDQGVVGRVRAGEGVAGEKNGLAGSRVGVGKGGSGTGRVHGHVIPGHQAGEGGCAGDDGGGSAVVGLAFRLQAGDGDALRGHPQGVGRCALLIVGGFRGGGGDGGFARRVDGDGAVGGHRGHALAAAGVGDAAAVPAIVGRRVGEGVVAVGPGQAALLGEGQGLGRLSHRVLHGPVRVNSGQLVVLGLVAGETGGGGGVSTGGQLAAGDGDADPVAVDGIADGGGNRTLIVGVDAALRVVPRQRDSAGPHLQRAGQEGDVVVVGGQAAGGDGILAHVVKLAVGVGVGQRSVQIVDVLAVDEAQEAHTVVHGSGAVVDDRAVGGHQQADLFDGVGHADGGFTQLDAGNVVAGVDRCAGESGGIRRLGVVGDDGGVAGGQAAGAGRRAGHAVVEQGLVRGRQRHAAAIGVGAGAVRVGAGGSNGGAAGGVGPAVLVLAEIELILLLHDHIALSGRIRQENFGVVQRRVGRTGGELDRHIVRGLAGCGDADAGRLGQAGIDGEDSGAQIHISGAAGDVGIAADGQRIPAGVAVNTGLAAGDLAAQHTESAVVIVDVCAVPAAGDGAAVHGEALAGGHAVHGLAGRGDPATAPAVAERHVIEAFHHLGYRGVRRGDLLSVQAEVHVTDRKELTVQLDVGGQIIIAVIEYVEVIVLGGLGPAVQQLAVDRGQGDPGCIAVGRVRAVRSAADGVLVQGTAGEDNAVAHHPLRAVGIDVAGEIRCGVRRQLRAVGDADIAAVDDRVLRGDADDRAALQRAAHMNDLAAAQIDVVGRAVLAQVAGDARRAGHGELVAGAHAAALAVAGGVAGDGAAGHVEDIGYVHTAAALGGEAGDRGIGGEVAGDRAAGHVERTGRIYAGAILIGRVAGDRAAGQGEHAAVYVYTAAVFGLVAGDAAAQHAERAAVHVYAAALFGGLVAGDAAAVQGEGAGGVQIHAGTGEPVGVGDPAGALAVAEGKVMAIGQLDRVGTVLFADDVVAVQAQHHAVHGLPLAALRYGLGQVVVTRLGDLAQGGNGRPGQDVGVRLPAMAACRAAEEVLVGQAVVEVDLVALPQDAVLTAGIAGDAALVIAIVRAGGNGNMLTDGGRSISGHADEGALSQTALADGESRACGIALGQLNIAGAAVIVGVAGDGHAAGDGEDASAADIHAAATVLGGIAGDAAAVHVEGTVGEDRHTAACAIGGGVAGDLAAIHIECGALAPAVGSVVKKHAAAVRADIAGDAAAVHVEGADGIYAPAAVFCAVGLLRVGDPAVLGAAALAVAEGEGIVFADHDGIAMVCMDDAVAVEAEHHTVGGHPDTRRFDVLSQVVIARSGDLRQVGNGRPGQDLGVLLPAMAACRAAEEVLVRDRGQRHLAGTVQVELHSGSVRDKVIGELVGCHVRHFGFPALGDQAIVTVHQRHAQLRTLLQRSVQDEMITGVAAYAAQADVIGLAVCGGIAGDLYRALDIDAVVARIHAAARSSGGVVGDLAAVHIKLAVAVPAHAAAIVGAVVGDAAAVHGERLASDGHTAAAPGVAVADAVAADLTAVHGEIAAARIHAAPVVAGNAAAVHIELVLGTHLYADTAGAACMGDLTVGAAGPLAVAQVQRRRRPLIADTDRALSGGLDAVAVQTEVDCPRGGGDISVLQIEVGGQIVVARGEPVIISDNGIVGGFEFSFLPYRAVYFQPLSVLRDRMVGEGYGIGVGTGSGNKPLLAALDAADAVGVFAALRAQGPYGQRIALLLVRRGGVLVDGVGAAGIGGAACRLCGGIGRLCECRRGQHGQAERQCHEQTQYSFLHVGLLQRMCSHFSVMRGHADGQPRLPVKNPCIFTDFLYDGIIHRTLTCDARVFCVFRGIL